MVDRARAAGAKVVTGGRCGTAALEGAYYEPSLMVDAAQDSEIVLK
jgi:betaine-aldehyde dehydrogenase